jgi:hypothetical protein
MFASLFVPSLAIACSCLQSTTTQKYEASTMVFIAHITMTEEMLGDKKSENYLSKRYIKARYDVKEIFKGFPINGGIIYDSIYLGGNCSVGIIPGHEYIVFQNSSNEISICNGTTSYRKDDNSFTLRTLKMLRHRNEKTHNK